MLLLSELPDSGLMMVPTMLPVGVGIMISLGCSSDVRSPEPEFEPVDVFLKRFLQQEKSMNYTNSILSISLHLIIDILAKNNTLMGHI